MGTAKEYMESVRAAQQLIDGARARLSSMRVREGLRGCGYASVGSGGGARDAMAATDARIDAERRLDREMAGYTAEVDAGRAVCAGVRAANRSLPLWADALELYYCDGLTWQAAAAALGVSVRSAQDARNPALDWVDSRGIAAVREMAG